jgi:molecular chaperone GrpE (heat shock protein)
VAAVAEQLVATTSKFGLTAFGERGDPFDPNRHEAVAHLTSPEVTEPTCVDVLRRGYLLGNRLLRPAMVAVADPAGPGATEAPDAGEPAEPPEAGEPGEPAGPAGH